MRARKARGLRMRKRKFSDYEDEILGAGIAGSVGFAIPLVLVGNAKFAALVGTTTALVAALFFVGKKP